MIGVSRGIVSRAMRKPLMAGWKPFYGRISIRWVGTTEGVGESQYSPTIPTTPTMTTSLPQSSPQSKEVSYEKEINSYSGFYELLARNDKIKVRNKVFIDISQNKQPFQATSAEIIQLLNLLVNLRYSMNEMIGIRQFLIKLQFQISAEDESISDYDKLEILSLFGKLGYDYGQVSPSVRKNFANFITRIKVEEISRDFLSYSNFFSSIAKIALTWKELPETKRKELLSSIKSFGEVKNLPLLEAQRLIFGLEKLLVVKSYLTDFDAEGKKYYETLLDRVLLETYDQVNFNETDREKIKSNVEEEIPLSRALLHQIKILEKDKGYSSIKKKQLSLIYKGLWKEWKNEDMGVLEQFSTFQMLGELSIEFQKLPKALWQVMMEGTVEKMRKDGGNKVNRVFLPVLLKGWRGMKVTWNDLNEDLQDTVMNQVYKLPGNGLSPRETAHALLHLGHLQVDWEKDVKRKDEFYEAFKAVSKEFIAENHSNLLFGLALMRASWINLPEDVQRSLLESTGRGCLQMNHLDIRNTIFSLAKMGVLWSTIPEEVANNLLEVIVKKHADYTSPEMCYLISNLGKMIGPVEKLPVEVKEKFKNGVIRIAGGKQTTVAKDIPENPAYMFYSLYRIGLQWKDFTPETQEALANMILRSVNDFNLQEICYTMKSLFEMIKNDKTVWKANYFVPLNTALIVRFPELQKSSSLLRPIDVDYAKSYREWLKSLPDSVFIPLIQSVKRQQPNLPSQPT